MQDQVTELSLLFGFIQRHAALVKQLDCALSPHGISFTEFSVLHQLQLAPQQTLRRVELAGTVGLSASGVTRLLLPMEKIGLVDREANPRDARVSLVRMTRAGRTLYHDATTSVQHAAERFLESFSSSQSNQFHVLLQKLR